MLWLLVTPRSFQHEVSINIPASPNPLCAALRDAAMAAQCCGVSPPPRWPRHLLGAHRAWLAPSWQRRQSLTFFLFSPPPLCECVTVRRDIVRRSVGSTKGWLCWPPYKNSRLSSFFLEVLSGLHTRIFVLPAPLPDNPSAALSKSLRFQPSPAAHTETSKIWHTRSELRQLGRNAEYSFLEKTLLFFLVMLPVQNFSAAQFLVLATRLFPKIKPLKLLWPFPHRCKHREGRDAGILRKLLYMCNLGIFI